MRTLIKVEEKMTSEAEFGLYFLYYPISLKKAEELQKLGFIVNDSHDKKTYPRLHKIDWSQAGAGIFDYENISDLNENDSKLTLPQKLWIISTKSKKIL